MEALAIIMLSVLAAVTYGVLHDQVTARVCIEYFTIGHPQILAVATSSPTVLGFVWGVVATWWVGFGLGIPLAVAARAGSRPKKAARQLVRPLLLLMTVAATLALCAGMAGYAIACQGWIVLQEPIAERVPEAQHAPFIADAFAHTMSYAAGAIGGLVLIVQTWRSRRQ